jgi:nucleoside-diphosphate-sugar epimerase
MTVLVTGSAGHLGEALVRTLQTSGRAVRAIARLERDEDAFSPLTRLVGEKGYHRAAI